jgi:hypothetical protein
MVARGHSVLLGGSLLAVEAAGGLSAEYAIDGGANRWEAVWAHPMSL